MVLLCRDPQGETVTTVPTVTPVPTIRATATPSQGQVLTCDNSNWEKKVSSLKEAMDEKDRIISQLQDKIKVLTEKVIAIKHNHMYTGPAIHDEIHISL